MFEIRKQPALQSESITFYVVRAKSGMYLNPTFTEPSLKHPLLFTPDVSEAFRYTTRTHAGKAIASFSEASAPAEDTHPIMTELLHKEAAEALEGAEIVEIRKEVTYSEVPIAMTR